MVNMKEKMIICLNNLCKNNKIIVFVLVRKIKDYRSIVNLPDKKIKILYVYDNYI